MQEGKYPEVDRLGSKLSATIECAVRLGGYGKNVFVCSHVVAFSVSRLAGSDDWSWAKEKHDEAIKGRR